jgi:hypothetical protein
MDKSFLGPPPPVTELTMEQEFKLRRMDDLLPEADKADIITLLMALQHQNFCLCNTVSNLVKQWPTSHPPITQEVPWKRGTLYETKD